MGKKGGSRKKKDEKDKQKRVRKQVQLWKSYDLGETAKKKNKVCPKCGSGTLMANHKNRDTCGKCGYTEFKK